MPKRVVDKRKTAKALRKLRRAAERAGEEGAPDLTHWEKEFVEGVTKRLETYGSAFRDPGKGRLEEALSQRQTHVARVIDKKSRKRKSKPGKAADDKPPVFRGSTLKRKTPLRARPPPSRSPRVRDVNDDLAGDVSASPVERRRSLQVIDGGKPPAKPPGKHG